MYKNNEYGLCAVCGKKGNLVRTYFYYPIKCTCCSPEHFELVRHHEDCVPKEPLHTKIEFDTRDLVEQASFVSKFLTFNQGLISDGYNTFNELYFHRMLLFSIICRTYKDKAWKSKLHDDGTMDNNYFIAGITTPEGDYTYHYHMEYWDHFDIPELPNAPKWEGHKPGDIGRLRSLLTKN